jgi:hypothetical protein
MNRFSFKLIFVFAACFLTTSMLQAQFTTTFAKNVNPGQQSGFYYSLPQTMLQLDFIIEETQCEPGPLSAYASLYFEHEEMVEYSSMEYKLLDVRMKQVATPDPNATFFVSVGAVRGGSKAEFDILPNGIIRSVGSGSALVESESQQKPQEPLQIPPCMAKSRNQGFIKLITSGKSDAQIAREAADKIAGIRDSKFKLISGYYETAYTPESFREMYSKLEEMEQDYLSLFLGSRVTSTVVRPVYVIPSKEVLTQTVAKFSESDGLTTGTSGSGSPITVQTLPLNNTAGINAPSQSAVESMSYDNKLFYRVPETANVKVSLKNTTLIEERLIISQLGVLLMAPFANTRMDFDTETGQIINMKMQ